MPFSPPGGVALSFVFAVAFGGAVGLVAGLFTLPFAAAGRVRDAVEAGPTPELLPNVLLLSAAGGTLFAALHFCLALAHGHGLFAVSGRETVTFVAGGTTALVAAAFLVARGFEAAAEGRTDSVGVGGGCLLAAVGAGYGAAVTVLSFVR